MPATAPLCHFGWKAVDARLPATEGRPRSILDLAGPNGLVVAFICNHCPYVKAVIGRIVRDAIDLKAQGIGFVAINSNDPIAYPEDSFEKMKQFSAEHRLPFPYLLDTEQWVARAYGAVCTPDFFGFNQRMELQYRGRLDASRKEISPANLRRDLYEAMIGIARTGKGPEIQTPSIGCSIKWKADPSWGPVETQACL